MPVPCIVSDQYQPTNRTICFISSLIHIYRWFKPYYPYYCFPASEVSGDFLEESFSSDDCIVYSIVTENRRAESAVTKYLTGELEGLINIEFGAADAWFEEDEQIFVHPKDPYKVGVMFFDRAQ